MPLPECPTTISFKLLSGRAALFLEILGLSPMNYCTILVYFGHTRITLIGRRCCSSALCFTKALGLDFGEDTGIKENVDSFLVFFDGLGPTRYAYFLGGW